MHIIMVFEPDVLGFRAIENIKPNRKNYKMKSSAHTTEVGFHRSQTLAFAKQNTADNRKKSLL